MCKRSDDDLLIRVLTDRYKLNILRLPRRNVQVGELLIREQKDLRCAGPIKRLFDPELDIALNEPVPLPDVEGVMSVRRSANVAAAPLTTLLTLLGATGVSSIGAAIREARDVSVAFGLTGTQYRSTDLLTLGDELSSRVLRHGNALYHPDRELFVAYATAQATGINLAFSSGSDRAAQLTFELAEIVKTDASVQSATDRSGRLKISSPEPVTFGLAVVQITTDGDALRLKSPDRPRAVRGPEDTPTTADNSAPVLFGGTDGDMLVEIG